LVDQSETELPGTEKTLAFSIAAETGGAFSLEEVASGLNFPTAMATAPDGRIFVTELVTGNIRVVTPNPLPQQWTVQTAPFATLPVVTGNEKGLLGIAVHPNFSQNGFVYVFYTATGPVNRVVRFTVTTSGGDTVATNATPEIIFNNIPAANDHNGGFIQFGPDGMLYIFVGENDVRDDAQSLSTLRGKILRINPDGGIPSDNPFFNTLLAPFSASSLRVDSAWAFMRTSLVTFFVAGSISELKSTLTRTILFFTFKSSKVLYFAMLFHIK